MSEFSDLAKRIRNGDREALAEFMVKRRARLIRRIRGKLTACNATMDDAEDVFLSAARRLDIACLEGRLEELSEDDLEVYIMTTMMNLAREKIRADQSRERTLRRRLRDVPQATNESEPVTHDQLIESVLAQLAGWERRMLELKLRDVPHRVIAREMGLTLSAERSRWQRLRRHVKALLAPPAQLAIYSDTRASHGTWRACMVPNGQNAPLTELTVFGCGPTVVVQESACVGPIGKKFKGAAW